MNREALIERTLKLADHTAVSIIVAVQFLASMFFLLSTPFLFNYGGAAAHPDYFLLWIVNWGVSVITAVILHKDGRSWLSQCTALPRRRIPALLWNVVLLAYMLLNGKFNGQSPADRFALGFVIYIFFALAYLAATSMAALRR